MADIALDLTLQMKSKVKCIALWETVLHAVCFATTFCVAIGLLYIIKILIKVCAQYTYNTLKEIYIQ